MILRKDIEAILSNPDALQKLQTAYNKRYRSPEDNARYKTAVKAFQVQMENSKLNKNLS